MIAASYNLYPSAGSIPIACTQFTQFAPFTQTLVRWLAVEHEFADRS